VGSTVGVLFLDHRSLGDMSAGALDGVDGRVQGRVDRLAQSDAQNDDSRCDTINLCQHAQEDVLRWEAAEDKDGGDELDDDDHRAGRGEDRYGSLDAT